MAGRSARFVNQQPAVTYSHMHNNAFVIHYMQVRRIDTPRGKYVSTTQCSPVRCGRFFFFLEFVLFCFGFFFLTPRTGALRIREEREEMWLATIPRQRAERDCESALVGFPTLIGYLFCEIKDVTNSAKHRARASSGRSR